MEGDVGCDQGTDVGGWLKLPAGFQGLLECFDSNAWGVTAVAAFSCKACRETVKHLTDLIEAHDPLALKWCDGETAFAVFDQ